MKKVLSIIFLLVLFSINLCAEESYVVESGVDTLSDGTVLTYVITENAEDYTFNISWGEVYEDFSFHCIAFSPESSFTSSTIYVSNESDNQSTTVIIHAEEECDEFDIDFHWNNEP